MEDKIKKSYEKINISDGAKNRIETAIIMDEQNKKRHNTLKIRRIKVAVAACLALAFLLPAGVFAAQKIYKYFTASVNEKGDYSFEIEMNRTDNPENNKKDAKDSNDSNITQQYIKLITDFGDDYISENEFYGWKSYGDKDDPMISYEHKEGFASGKCFWYELHYIDGEMEDVISIYNTEVNEMFTVNGRKAVYSKLNTVVGSKYTDDYKCDYGQSMYVFIEDYGYVLEMVAQNGLSKEDFIHLAESIKIEKADSKEEASKFALFSERQLTGHNIKSENEIPSEEIPDKNLASKKAKIGKTGFKLKEVKILDSITGLNKDAFITEHFEMKSLVSKKGKLKKYDREFMKLGDGVTEPEAKVIKTESVQLKLVYVTLEIDNSDALAVDGKYYVPSISFVMKKDGKNYIKRYRDDYNRPEYVDEALMDFKPCYIEENCGGKDGWAVKSSNDKITVHFAYLVDEDFTDEMALWLNDYASSADEHYKMLLSNS